MEYTVSPETVEFGHRFNRAVSGVFVNGYRAVVPNKRESIEELLPGSWRLEIPEEFAQLIELGSIEGRYGLCYEEQNERCEIELLRKTTLFRAEQLKVYFERELDHTKLYDDLYVYAVSQTYSVLAHSLDDVISKLGLLEGMHCNNDAFVAFALPPLVKMMVYFDKNGTIF